MVAPEQANQRNKPATKSSYLGQVEKLREENKHLTQRIKDNEAIIRKLLSGNPSYQGKEDGRFAKWYNGR
ncbi:hypothetical protein GGI12_003213 [Dipsacomyces acuminosporus]|nr:hypothetical protein GGI12_003213 [Dipsacomyces acuminosporus]